MKQLKLCRNDVVSMNSILWVQLNNVQIPSSKITKIIISNVLSMLSFCSQPEKQPEVGIYFPSLRFVMRLSVRVNTWVRLCVLIIKNSCYFMIFSDRSSICWIRQELKFQIYLR